MSGIKIITPVGTEPVTLAEARLQLRLTDSDGTTEDSLIAIWISTARGLAEHFSGRALAQQTLEVALDEFPCYESDLIVLPMGPVGSITSVKYTDTAGVEQTISPSAYALSTYGDCNRLTPTYGNYWPATQSIPEAVRIRYVAGYGASGAPALPKEVKAAMLLMVDWMYEHRGSEMDPDDIQPPAAKALLGTVKDWSRW